MRVAVAGMACCGLALVAGCASGTQVPPTPTAITPSIPIAASPPAIVTATSVATLPTTPTARPSPTPSTLVVARTEGEGLSLRRTPGASGERIKVWPDGTRLLWLGEEQQVDGLSWRRLRDPEDNEGWAAAQFLVDEATFATLPTAAPAPAAPAATARAATAAPTAGPTRPLPALRPTFTPVPPAQPTAVPKPGAPTATAPPKPAAPTAPPAAAPTQTPYIIVVTATPSR